MDRSRELRVGDVRKIDGVISLITDGFYIDPTYGRISNHWTWRPVRPDGSLGRSRSGYGGDYFGPRLRHRILIKVK